MGLPGGATASADAAFASSREPPADAETLRKSRRFMRGAKSFDSEKPHHAGFLPHANWRDKPNWTKL
jgi:hypothetical protein